MTITIGLVGCGLWGKFILRDLLALGCRVLVADVSEKSRAAALGLGAAGVFAGSDALPDCSGYVLAVPIPELCPEALTLLARGKPIFSEKTLCPGLDQARLLAAAGADGLIFLMHKWEYHRGVHALRALVQTGRLGELKFIECVRQGWDDSGRAGDVLSILAVHDLTIARHILGVMPTPVYSLIRRQDDGLATGLFAVLGHEPKVTLSVDARHPCRGRRVCLHGSFAAAALDGAYSGHILLRDASGEEKIPFDNRLPLFEELKEFCAYLQGDPPPRCGFDHAVQTAGALDALRRLDRQAHIRLE